MAERDPLAVIVERVFREARREGVSISDAADIVAAGMRNHLEERTRERSNTDSNMIRVQSIFGARSGLPLVEFLYGLENFTLEVEQARRHALNILACAETASQDAALYRWLTLSEQLSFDPTTAAAAIHDLRRFRGDAEKQDWRNLNERATEDIDHPQT